MWDPCLRNGALQWIAHFCGRTLYDWAQSQFIFHTGILSQQFTKIAAPGVVCVVRSQISSTVTLSPHIYETMSQRFSRSAFPYLA